MSNPFQPLNLKNKPKAVSPHNYVDEQDLFIIEYKEVQAVKKTGEKDTDFILDSRVEVDSKVNRSEYINSFREDVGIMNILEKVRLTGDATLLNQTKRSPVPSVKTGKGNLEDIVDISDIPNSFIEADQAIMKGHDLFKDLPAELKGKLSFEDFVVKSPDIFEKYVTALKEAAKQKATESEVK